MKIEREMLAYMHKLNMERSRSLPIEAAKANVHYESEHSFSSYNKDLKFSGVKGNVSRKAPSIFIENLQLC
jgi:hypothetical protein